MHEQRQYLCYRAERPLELSGSLDKPLWERAPWTDDFVDIEGDTRHAPRFRTRAKLLWDDAFLYIGAEMEEPNVWATLAENDWVIFRTTISRSSSTPTGTTTTTTSWKSTR